MKSDEVPERWLVMARALLEQIKRDEQAPMIAAGSFFGFAVSNVVEVARSEIHATNAEIRRNLHVLLDRALDGHFAADGTATATAKNTDEA